MVEETAVSFAASNRKMNGFIGVASVALPVHELSDLGAAETLGQPLGQVVFQFADSEPEPARAAGRDAPPWPHAFEQRGPALVVAYCA
jgi:hypothetical protein